jgi:hypothetical protein
MLTLHPHLGNFPHRLFPINPQGLDSYGIFSLI